MMLTAIVLTSLAFAGDLPSIDEPLRTGRKAPADAGVAIGIEDYLRPGVPTVPHAARDAEAFSDFLVSTRGIPTDRVQLIEENANATKIRLAVTALGRSVGEGGVAWVYFAGHGGASLDGGSRMLLGDDVSADPESFDAGGVLVSEIEALAGAGGGRVVIVVDACYTGTGRDGQSFMTGKRTLVPAAALVAKPAGTSVWSAASAGQTSGPLDAVEHGAFTYFALGALRGWADGSIDGQHDEEVTLDEAHLYVTRALKTARITSQTPEVVGARDLVLSVRATEPAPTISSSRADASTSKPQAADERVAAPRDDFQAKLEAAKRDAAAEAEREFITAEAAKVREGKLASLSEAKGSDFQSSTLGPMKWIPAGSFTMGSPRKEEGRGKDETEHLVTLTKGYWMMEHEVTQGQWEAVMGKNPATFAECGKRCAVETVSWNDAVAFAKAASTHDGTLYRLPTEAEWELAARGGSRSVFSGSSDVSEVGWIRENSDASPHKVCRLKRNGYGLCDMSGNVSEWVSDKYDSYRGAATDPTGADAGRAVVIRGGSWHGKASSARVAVRDEANPHDRADVIGFRLVRPAP